MHTSKQMIRQDPAGCNIKKILDMPRLGWGRGQQQLAGSVHGGGKLSRNTSTSEGGGVSMVGRDLHDARLPGFTGCQLTSVDRFSPGVR